QNIISNAPIIVGNITASHISVYGCGYIGGEIYGDVTLYGGGLESGTFYGNMEFYDDPNEPNCDSGIFGTVIGNVSFYDNMGLKHNTDYLTATQINFYDNSFNNGNISGDCIFNDYSINGQTIMDEENNIIYIGNITGNCTFNDSSVNWGTITGNCVFNNLETYGMITGNCIFNPGSVFISGIINGDAIFYSAGSDGGWIIGTAIFNGDSYMMGGQADYAIFNGNTYVDVDINYDATFNDNSHSNYINCGGTLTYNDASYHDVNASSATSSTLVLGTRTPYPLRSGINNSNILGLI
ncbi:MAG: hypothetical protein ACKO7N_02010, partial [Candidatus Nitrosotenuis sp.]